MKLYSHLRIVFLLSAMLASNCNAQTFVFSDITYQPFDSSCKDYLKQVSSIVGKQEGGIYIESDVLKFSNTNNFIMGLVDALHLKDGLSLDASSYHEDVLEECNKRANLDKYWSDYLRMKPLIDGKTYTFNKNSSTTCFNVKVLALNMVRSLQDINGAASTLAGLMAEEDYQAYNASIDLKNYLHGFSQGFKIDFMDTFMFLFEYCADKKDETKISDALKYIAENPSLIGK